MSINSENLDSWFKSLADEALDRNNKSVITWTKYKDDLEGTKKTLSWLPKKLKHDVMIPVGPKALMRGKIVHTNELLVSLGDTWFLKKTASQTIDLCDRRIKECDNMLEKLKKERELIESKKSLPAEKEAFGSDERPEIVECVTEEEHEEWKRQHRVKEREYRKKLAELRNKKQKPIETEEDLWKRLDELELREELEDELARLNADDDIDKDESDEDLKLNDHMEQENTTIESNDLKAVADSQNHRVTFSMDNIYSSDDSPNILEIKHSSIEPKSKPFTGDINSPEDIYQSYLKNHQRKSILKNTVNINREVEELNCLRNCNEIEDDENEQVNYHVIPGIVLPDIINNEDGDRVQRLISDNSFKEPTRRISKFKASRMRES